MLARLFVIFGGLFVLALTAALVVPYFVDWSSYRADFEREAGAILGRKVTVHGEATATLLPFPSVTFSEVEVGARTTGEPAMTAETFSMDAELAPLLSGEFRIFDMRLVRPKATIEIAADGTIDWAVRPSTPFDASQISIEKLTITEGQVDVHHAGSGRIHRLTEINTEVSARSLAGPWRMEGSMRVDGMRSAITVNTGRAGDGGMRLRIQAEPDVQKIALDLDGELRFKDGASAKYAGDFRLSARRDQQDGAAAPESSPGFRTKGTFELDDQRLVLDTFRFETGPLDNPYHAEGRGDVDFGAEPRFSLTLDGAQVRFDEAIGAGDSTGLTLADRLSALQEAFLDLPKPSIPGTLEVNLPAVVAGDTTIRDVRFSAEPAANGWKIESLAATLPGRAKLEADGLLRTDDQFGFKGSLLLAVGQPSGFAAWVARDVDEAIRKLPSAGFRATVDLTRDRQSFSDLELGLGDAVFRGQASRTQPQGQAPSTVLKLEGGALDLEGLTAFASLFITDLGASRFSEGDLDLQVKAGPVDATGLTARSVDAAIRLREGLLEIDRLSVTDLAGATISATGTVRDFPANPSGNIDASLVAVDLSPLIAAAAERFGDNPSVQWLNARARGYTGLFQDARMDIVATAASNGDGTSGLAVSAQGKTGGTALSATFSATGGTSDLPNSDISLVLSARNDDATELLALSGFSVLPLGVTGPGETDFSLKGKLSGDLATTLDLRGDGFSSGFTGTVNLSDGLGLKGQARLNATDLEPWLMTTGVALPGMGAGMPVELEAGAEFTKGLLAFSSLAGTVNQAAVSGDVKVAVDGAKPEISGQLTLDEMNLEPLLAMVLGETALESTGDGWSSVPFAPEVSSPFAANIGISAATLTAGPWLTSYDSSFTLKLDDEALRVSDLAGKLFDGEVTGLLELKNNDGTGLLSSQMRLVDADIPAVLGDAGLSGRTDVSAALSASGKSVGGLVSALSGSGTAAFRSLVVQGVNTAALPELIARADQYGKDIDAGKTASFAPEIVSSGSFAADPGEIAFTIAGGVLRAPPLKLTNTAATIDANLQSDFNSEEVAVSGTITYDPGVEELVGSEPAVRFTMRGPLGMTATEIDTGPLAQFLTQRALEIEQARVEGMQSALLEKQRLRREVRYYAALQDSHDKVVAEWRRQQEEARKAEEAEKEARRQAEEEARLKAEAEERARQVEAQKARLEAERKAREEAAERARVQAEEAARQAAEAARLEAEAAALADQQEKARVEAEARAQREAEERARQAAEAARMEAERAAQAERETRARIEAEERARRDAEERSRQKLEEAARQAAEEANAVGQGPSIPTPPAQEAPRRPQADVGGSEAPSQKDGFIEMLFGQ